MQQKLRKVLFVLPIIAIFFISAPATAADIQPEMQKHINIERQQAGLPPLEIDDDLSNGASIRAVEIQTLFAHQRPDDREVQTVLSNSSYNRFGENLAIVNTRSIQRIVRAWMHSPFHRTNILGRRYTSMGAGCEYNKEDMHYYCALLLAGN